MVSSKLKKQFEEIVRVAVAPLGNAGVTPNMLTILGVLLASLTGYAYTLAPVNRVYLVYCGVLIIVSGFVDAIDGVLARSTGKVTRFGGFFDSVADRYSDAVIYTGIIVAGLCNQLTGLITLFSSMLVSYARARAEMEGVKMAGVGLAETSLSEAVTYVKERSAFGNLLSRYENVSFKLAEADTLLVATRLLCYQCLRLRDQGLPHTKESAMAKWFGAQSCVKVLHDILLISTNLSFSLLYYIVCGKTIVGSYWAALRGYNLFLIFTPSIVFPVIV